MVLRQQHSKAKRTKTKPKSTNKKTHTQTPMNVQPNQGIAKMHIACCVYKYIQFNSESICIHNINRRKMKRILGMKIDLTHITHIRREREMERGMMEHIQNRQ